jgi:hypothetical protein
MSARQTGVSKGNAMSKQLHLLGDRLCADHALLQEQMSNMKRDIEDLGTEVREQRKWFQQRLDRLDSRVWALVIMMLGTLIGTIVKLFI